MVNRVPTAARGATGSARDITRQKKSPEYQDAGEYAADESGEIAAGISA
jgi:hypothetical protein